MIVPLGRCFLICNPVKSLKFLSQHGGILKTRWFENISKLSHWPYFKYDLFINCTESAWSHLQIDFETSHFFLHDAELFLFKLFRSAVIYLQCIGILIAVNWSASLPYSISWQTVRQIGAMYHCNLSRQTPSNTRSLVTEMMKYKNVVCLCN